MSSDGVSTGRRQFLTVATSVIAFYRPVYGVRMVAQSRVLERRTLVAALRHFL